MRGFCPIAARTGPSGALDRGRSLPATGPRARPVAIATRPPGGRSQPGLWLVCPADGGLSWAAPEMTSIHPASDVARALRIARRRVLGGRSRGRRGGAEERGTGRRRCQPRPSCDYAGATFGTSAEIRACRFRTPHFASAAAAFCRRGCSFVSWEALLVRCNRDRIVADLPRRTDVERADGGRPCDALAATRSFQGSRPIRPRRGAGSGSRSRTTRCRRRAPPEWTAWASTCGSDELGHGGATWSDPSGWTHSRCGSTGCRSPEGASSATTPPRRLSAAARCRSHSLAATPFGGKLRQAIMALQAG